MTQDESDEFLDAARDALERQVVPAGKRCRALALLAARLAHARTARAAKRPLAQVVPVTGPRKPN